MKDVTLRVGVFGAEVAALHRGLQQNGFSILPAEIQRRFFGPSTRDAVRSFQESRNLPVTGDADAATLAALSQGETPEKPAAPDVKPKTPAIPSNRERRIPKPLEPDAVNSTAKAAKLARLPSAAARRLAAAVPDRTLLDDASVGSLVAEGAMEERDALRLGLASVALDVTEDDEVAADKVLTELEKRGIKKPQDLARLSTEEIAATIERSGILTPEDARERGVDLKRKVARAFPTETLIHPATPRSSPAGRSPAASKSPTLSPEIIKRVVDRNPDVDLLRLDLSRHSTDRKNLDLSGLSETEKKAALRDLQIRKDMLIVADDAEIADRFLTTGLNSPNKLIAMPIDKLAEIAGSSKKQAKYIHDRAHHSAGRSANAMFTLWDAFRGGLENTAVGNIRGENVEAYFDGLDNVQELFGRQDSCQCQHCNSVLGPAAYFVDLMHFIQAHVLKEAFGESEDHELHLWTRRPDLLVLPLTCENTDTEIPQLAITTEIFENYIAKKHGFAIEVDRTEVLAAVYGDFLPSGEHSVLQPILVPIEELEIYLGHFGLHRRDIVRLLGKPDEVRFRAEIGMTERHAGLVTLTDTLFPTRILRWPHPAGKMPMHDLVDAIQISRSELEEMLQTKFVGADQPPIIEPAKKTPDSVQYDIEYVYGLTKVHLDRVHRFLRLKNHLPWSPTELDAFLASSGEGKLDRTALSDIGRAIYVQRRFQANIQELCGVAGALPQFPVVHRHSSEPIDILFNVPDIMRDGPLYPGESIRFVLGNNTDETNQHAMRLRAGLRLQEDELTALIEGLSDALTGNSGNNTNVESRLFSRVLHQKQPFAFADPATNETAQPRLLAPEPIGVTFPLTRYNLSVLYRHAVLGRWLKLKAADLLTLIRLTPGVGDHVENLTDCIALIEFYDWWKSTPFSIEDLALLLAPASHLDQQIETLWKALQSWIVEEAEAKLTDTFLVEISGVSESLSREILKNNATVFEAINERYRLSANWRKEIDLSALEGSSVSSEAVISWIADQDRSEFTDTSLVGISGVSEALSREIIKSNATAFEAINDGYRISTAWRLDTDINLSVLEGTDVSSETVIDLIRSHHPDGRLARALTAALRSEIELIHAVVQTAITDDNEIRLSDFLVEDSLPTKLRPALGNVLRLHCIATTLRLAPQTMTFLAQNQIHFGISSWHEPNQKALQKITALQSMIKQRFDDQPGVVFEQILGLFEDANKLPTAAALLFDIDLILARNLASMLNVPENPIDALSKLASCATMADKLSVDAGTLFNIASEEYSETSAAAAAVLAGFCAKYPNESDWREKIEPFEERVLEKKRDALIDYLLHPSRDPESPDAQTQKAYFPDTAEMYKYFLIDGEVDGCFRTSRIVAANSSLQLYVHRIRMNLEKAPDGRFGIDPSLVTDEEWEWRKNYRVWEANRKIFLWPENYLDPTIRDDKTPLFEELESELLQQEVTEQTVTDAYANYLRSLEELANLRYAGAYHDYLEDVESTEVKDVIYLFGATGGDAPTHYWREIHNLAHSQNDPMASPYYGPWQKVETRIPTRHVSPIIFNGQLYVFWNEITTTARNALDDGKSSFIGYSHRYVLKFTSLRLDGQWTPSEQISLYQSAPVFRESNDAIDDPIAEQMEEDDLQAARKKYFQKFPLWHGVYSRSRNEDEIDAAKQKLLKPRYDTSPHTKAREGYTLDGFMWERPYLSLNPENSERLLINCAGFHVRGEVDLFERRVIKAAHTDHKTSPSVGRQLLARRASGSTGGPRMLSFRGPRMLSFIGQASPSSSELVKWVWGGAPFDYSVAAALALNRGKLEVFSSHWVEEAEEGDEEAKSLEQNWQGSSNVIADVPKGAGTWSVDGTATSIGKGLLGIKEVVIETEDDLLLLRTGRFSDWHGHLHRMGTTRVRDMARTLFSEGLDGLLDIKYQLDLSEPPPKVGGELMIDMTEQTRNPLKNESAYGVYYQEIFQHIPLLLAHHLNAQGKFEEAQHWYHFVFDPTSSETITDPDVPATDRNWKYRQFRGQEQSKLGDALSAETAIRKYREDPFNAHAIARLRISAYQKAVVMRYIDNLLDWADERFTRFQMESINEAMMLYVTAAEVLGPRPAQLGECGEMQGSTRTYDSLKDSFSDEDALLIEIEELIPSRQSKTTSSNSSSGTSPGSTSYGLNSLFVSSANIANANTVSGIRPKASSSVGGRGTYTTTSANPNAFLAIGATVDHTKSHSELTEAISIANNQLQPFIAQQQFNFLGGNWKVKGGRTVPSTLGDRFSHALVQQVTVAFCIPRNELLDGYWHRVEDRIRKIRTCQDIAGRKRKLSLFAPPIDPNLLARARALGISLDDAISAFEGMIPLYRFSYLLEKAKAFASTVQSFGSALQSALERKDGEELTLLQATQQQQILALTTKAKEWELESAQVNLKSTERRRIAVENRRAHYAELLDTGLNEWEITESISTHLASTIRGTAAISNFIAAILGLSPKIGSPFAMTYGGEDIVKGPKHTALALGALADLATNVAASARIEAGHKRRSEDWTFQRDQARDELRQIEKQIEAARISHDLAKHAIELHEKSVEHNEELREYYEDKFSNLGFYTSLASELQRTYREAYNMAYRMARYAEQAYRFEREDYTSELLSGQYWEAARAGLLAGNKLTLDIQYLEQRYIETDQPKRNLVNHNFSLRQWNPRALIDLRQNGECEFEVPELFFDISSPGDYRRRIRSVRVSIPAVAGPFTNVMATLSLDKSCMRTSPRDEELDLPEAPRPRIDSITTSSAQNDAGVFELNFRGEKYVPFEGAGAISTWKLSLPTPIRMFDYNTISDVVLHLDYTASHDGVLREKVQDVTNGLATSIKKRLSDPEGGLTRVFSLREEFYPTYSRLVAGDSVDLEIDERHLPFFGRDVNVKAAALILAGTNSEPVSISGVEFDGQIINAVSPDESDQSISVALPILNASHWQHKLRLVELSGKPSNIYLLMTLNLTQTAFVIPES